MEKTRELTFNGSDNSFKASATSVHKVVNDSIVLHRSYSVDEDPLQERPWPYCDTPKMSTSCGRRRKGTESNGISFWSPHCVPTSLLRSGKSVVCCAVNTPLTTPNVQIISDGDFTAVIGGVDVTFSHFLLVPAGEFTETEINSAISAIPRMQCPLHSGPDSGSGPVSGSGPDSGSGPASQSSSGSSGSTFAPISYSASSAYYPGGAGSGSCFSPVSASHLSDSGQGVAGCEREFLPSSMSLALEDFSLGCGEVLAAQMSIRRHLEMVNISAAECVDGLIVYGWLGCADQDLIDLLRYSSFAANLIDKCLCLFPPLSSDPSYYFESYECAMDALAVWRLESE